MNNDKSKPEVRYFTSQEAAKILGVNVSSIKRWTDEGKLRCIASAGGHRKFLFSHLAEFLESRKSKSLKANIFPVESAEDLEISHRIMRRDFTFLTGHVLSLALECRRDQIERVLHGLYLGQVSLHEIYDQLLVPVLRQLGDMWSKRSISVTAEHFASQTLKDAIIRLQGSVRKPSSNQGRVLCVTLSNELHDIGLKMVDHLLELRGFHVLYSGQITPAEDIGQILDVFRPQRVYISSTWIHDVAIAQQELETYELLCSQHGISLFLGGAGFEKLTASSGTRLWSFSEVASV